MNNTISDSLYRDYDRLSRYQVFPYFYYYNDSKYCYGTTAQLKNNTNYINYIVQVGDTFDTLALKFYNNPTYYWIICDFNRIQDPFSTLKEGATIKIPTFSDIEYDM